MVARASSSVTQPEETTVSEEVDEAELRKTLKRMGLELRDCVDKGSYAAVYKAVSTVSAEEDPARPWLGEVGKVFAVKVLLTKMINEDAVRDFRREAEVLGRVDHPGIIKMHYYGKNPQPYMVTEFCDAGNLWNAIRCEQVKVSNVISSNNNNNSAAPAGLQNAPETMPMLDVPAVAMDVARALAYLHSAGFAHRDIKSSNVLLTWCPEEERIQAKLCDFGSAAPVSRLPRRPSKPQWGGLEKWLGFTGRWQPVGTMLWMAPEMLEPPVEGKETPQGYSGDKVDVYSLAVVLWELMEWRVPWVGRDVSKEEVVDSVVRRQERLPIPSACDDRLAELMTSMWKVSPADRPGAARVVDELERFDGSWDKPGHFARVANAANARGREIADLLASSASELRAQEILEDEEIQSKVEEEKKNVGGEEAAEEEEVGVVEVSSSSSSSSDSSSGQEDSVVQLGENNDEAVADDDDDDGEETATAVASLEETETPPPDQQQQQQAEPPEELVEPENWFGPVGSVDLDDFNAMLVPMLFPHVLACTVSADELETLERQRSELADLEKTATEMKSRSKMDPFAAFSAEGKVREVRRLRKQVKLATAEGKVNAWRVTRDILREQLVEAETQHLEWRRKYREIERDRG